MLMGVKEIQEIIPHRHPFLLVDCIEELEPGVRAVGYKCVTYDESFFKGHFPQEPVMPGVLLVEALAQTGAVAILSQEGSGEGGLLWRHRKGQVQTQGSAWRQGKAGM